MEKKRVDLAIDCLPISQHIATRPPHPSCRDYRAGESSLSWLIGAFCLSHICLDEGEWQQVAHAFQPIYPIGSAEQYFDGLLVSVLYLENYLPAGSARRHGLGSQPIVVGCRYGQALDGLLGVVGLCSEDGGSLGAEPGGIGCVLLVGPYHDASVVEPQGCSHPEPTIFGVGVAGGLGGRLHQLCLLGR